ncbi:MAG: hypothetical protein GYA24_25915 [Candidatus Lokiarchaeota archaeon]|nr:hypothetical protein [Candidatus Lokiarchaeota archaeon]
MAFEPEIIDGIERRNILSPDPRKNLYEEDVQSRGRLPRVKREISRNHFNKFEDFIADVCDETYSHLVEYRLSKRRRLD